MSAERDAADAIYNAIKLTAETVGLSNDAAGPAKLLTLAQAHANLAYGPEGGAMRWDYHNNGANPEKRPAGFHE